MLLITASQAHAMLPHIGAGGSQGLEDALLLAELLSNPQTTSKNIDVSFDCPYAAVLSNRRYFRMSYRSTMKFGALAPSLFGKKPRVLAERMMAAASILEQPRAWRGSCTMSLMRARSTVCTKT